jgi:hypothetical protein
MIFPKKDYWDAFAARTSALCIHFKDLPQLASFDCPDLSHLDRNDAPRFTMELGQTLAARELLGAPTAVMASKQPGEKPEDCHCNAKSPCMRAPGECPCCASHSQDRFCRCEAKSQHS